MLKKFLLVAGIALAVLAPTTAFAHESEQHNKYDICDFQGFDENGEPLFVVLSNQSWSAWTELPPGDYDEVFVPNTLTEGSGDANQFRCSIAFGVTGPEGPEGPAGPPGADSEVPGPAGIDGEDGKDGSDGTTGPAGPAGSAGATGTAGATGSVGLTGLQGPPSEAVAALTADPVSAPLTELPRTGLANWLWALGAGLVFCGVCLSLWMRTASKA